MSETEETYPKFRIEFRQVADRKRSRGWAMLIQYHAEDIVAFLKWTGTFSDRDIYRVEDAIKDKRRTRPVELYPQYSGKWTVYPKEGYAEKFEVGLHYVCQHAFDILPYKLRSRFYNYYYRDEPWRLGTLYPIPKLKHVFPEMKESYPVTDRDIADGFGLDSQEVKKYSDSFTIWVIKRNETNNL